MDSYDRENLVGFGRAVASYEVWRNSSNIGEAVMEDAWIQAGIEGAHTRYMVGRNTGDMRLANRAGRSAAARTYTMHLGWFGVPFVMFLVPLILGMAVPAIGIHPNFFCFVWLPLCAVAFGAMGMKYRHTLNRNMYTRNNLPSADELNRSGYWQVERDVWWNPVTQRVLTGHAYSGVEAAQGRAAYRSESQQIRAIYRAQQSQPTGWPGLGRGRP